MRHVLNTFSYTALTFILDIREASKDPLKREPNVVTMVGRNMFGNTWWYSVKTRLDYQSTNPIPEQKTRPKTKRAKHIEHTMRAGLNYTWNPPKTLSHHGTNTIDLLVRLY